MNKNIHNYKPEKILTGCLAMTLLVSCGYIARGDQINPTHEIEEGQDAVRYSEAESHGHSGDIC